jgi:hypothetical protein
MEEQAAGHMFKKIHNNNMDRLTTADTLDDTYFKENFKEQLKTASKDDEGHPVHPFKNANAEFIKICDHAFDTGHGFHDWLYMLYADVRTALSDAIQDQTAGVVHGDLIGLLKAIKLAVHHSELNNPDALDIEYSKCTMELEGKQDLMTFTAALTNYMRRLVCPCATPRLRGCFSMGWIKISSRTSSQTPREPPTRTTLACRKRSRKRRKSLASSRNQLG